MKRRLLAASVIALTSAAHAQVRISGLPSATTLTGAEVLPAVQNGANVGVTPAQIKAYTGSGGGFGGFTLAGDCTLSAPTITCTKTSGVAFAATATTLGLLPANNLGDVSSTSTARANLGLGSAATLASTAFDAAGAASAALASAEAYSVNASNLASGTVAGGLISGAYAGITGVGTLTSGSIPSTLITGLGTFATQSAASPPAIGGTTPNTGAFSTLTATTVNGLSLTSNATGFQVAGGTTSKTLVLQNSLTFAGADSTTMTFPSTSSTVMTLATPGTITGAMTIGTGDTLSTAGTGAFVLAGAGSLKAQAQVLVSNTPPTSPSAGLGSTTAVTYATGTGAIILTIGGTGITSTGSLAMPAAAHGWVCDGEDLTTPGVVRTTGGLSTTSVTLTFYNPAGAAAAPTSGDLVGLKCMGV